MPRHLTESADVDVAASLVQFIHDIEHKHHRSLEFSQLQRQEQGPPEVLGIGDLNDDGIRIVEQNIAGNPCVLATAGHCCTPGADQIDGFSPDLAWRRSI